MKNIKEKIENKPYLISLLIIFSLSIWFQVKEAPQKENTSLLNKTEEKTIKHKNIRTEEVELKEEDYKVSFNGTTEAANILLVYSREEGFIKKLNVKKGDYVKKGEILATIDSESLNSEVSYFENLLTEKKRQYEADLKLFKKGFSSKEVLTKSDTEYKKAISDLNKVKDKLKYTNITAKTSGYIGEVYPEEGEFILKNSKITEIHDLSEIKIEIDLPEKYISEIALNQLAEVEINSLNNIGYITFISKIADQETHTFKTEITIKNKDNIYSGLSSNVSINFNKIKGLKISPYILTVHKEKLGIKYISKNKVKFSEVKIIKTFPNNNVLIKGDLPNSFKLITLGQDYIEVGEELK